MSVIKRGARAGVAAIAVGLSLAGPHVTGIAGAEPADDDPSSVSAPRPDQTDRPRPYRSAAATADQVGDDVRAVRRGRVSRGIAGAAAVTDAVPVPPGNAGSAPRIRIPGP